jgi:plastocyanin
MKSQISLAILFGMIGIGLTACGSGESGSSRAQARQATPNPSPSMTVVIPMGAVGLGTAAYGTNPLTISAGTTVTWINQDDMAHTTTSDTGLWDSGLLAPGKTFSYTFVSGGSFSYHCAIHGAASMSGLVQVSGPTVPIPTPSPSPLEPTYTSVTNQVLIPHCMACHDGPSASAGLDFSSWQSLVHNPVNSALSVPGNALASVLYQHIEAGVPASSVEFMTAAEQQAIFNWIQAGAPNN